ncbi:conserved Plasmodium protein, unknown function [Plasmodium gallinaceum]|uniref:Plasmodium RESA N-terminal domain-containing protein n=1 Tax=Plasmodium gallinaceum TaxID=5849 RepID=A0A1J1GPS2_PLAGA|nr:conserved Plasmodium protein, unknown function [Plasmodium gallinaceum]CRG94300.1 conserved Plasmodium protein, unknown function [Plasmodium gallinaceum]
MLKRCAYFFFVIIIVLDKYGLILSSSNNKKENNELYLTRTKESYNFLEASLNIINNKGPSYNSVLNKLSNVDLPNVHHEVIKNLKFDKLKEIVNIKNSILNCILESVLHMVKALPAIIEEILEYNEFCSSIETQFSFLYAVDNEYQEKIEDCRTSTTDSIINSYFSFYLEDIDLIVKKYKEKPGDIFNRFDSIVECLDEFYKKVTRPFNEHVKETELFKDFMTKYIKPPGSTYVDYLKAFLDNFDSNWSNEKITGFFDELYYIYSTNNSYISCFYLI